jgi:hypothetical protein
MRDSDPGMPSGEAVGADSCEVSARRREVVCAGGRGDPVSRGLELPHAVSYLQLSSSGGIAVAVVTDLAPLGGILVTPRANLASLR